MAREDVILNFVARGGRNVVRTLGDIRTGSIRSRRAVGNLQRALLALGGFFTGRALVQYADQWTLINNRISTVTNTTREQIAVVDELFNVSQRTFSQLDANATLYGKLANSISGVTINADQLLGVIETVNQAIVLSAASTQAANAALIQFAQGLGKNRLDGDELKSVAENAPVLARTIARGLNEVYGTDYNIGNLRDAGAEGFLTAERVLKALQNQGLDIDRLFRKITPTVQYAFNNLQNAFTRFIGGANEATGITIFLSKALLLLADNLDAVVAAALVAGTVLGAGAFAQALKRLDFILVPLLFKLKALGVILLANPFGLVLTAISAVVAGLVAFRDKINVFGSDVITLGDAMKATWQLFMEATATARADFEALWGTFSTFVSDKIIKPVLGLNETIRVEVIRGLEILFNGLVGFFVGAFRAFGVLMDTSLATILKSIRQAVNEFWNGVLRETQVQLQSFVDAFANIIPALEGFKVTIPLLDDSLDQDVAELNGRLEAAFDSGFAVDYAKEITGAVNDTIDAIKTRSQVIADARIKEADDLKKLRSQIKIGGGPGASDDGAKAKGRSTADVIAELRRENEALAQQFGMTTAQAERFQETMSIINKQLKNNQTVTAEQKAIISELIDTQITYNDQLSDQRSQFDQIIAPIRDYTRAELALQRLLEEGLITLDQYEKQLREVERAFLDTQKDAMSGFKRGLMDIEDQITDFGGAVQDIMVGAFNSAEDAFVQFVQTGKLSFTDLVNSIFADLTRLAFRESIASIFGLGGGAGAGLFGGLFGTTAGDGGGVIGDFFGSLFSGFNNGGSFRVGSANTISGLSGSTADNRLVAFRAREGETVTVNKPGQGGGGSVTVNMNIYTQDAESFRRSENQIMARAQAAASRAAARNN